MTLLSVAEKSFKNIYLCLFLNHKHLAFEQDHEDFFHCVSHLRHITSRKCTVYLSPGVWAESMFEASGGFCWLWGLTGLSQGPVCPVWRIQGCSAESEGRFLLKMWLGVDVNVLLLFISYYYYLFTFLYNVPVCISIFHF